MWKVILAGGSFAGHIRVVPDPDELRERCYCEHKSAHGSLADDYFDALWPSTDVLIFLCWCAILTSEVSWQNFPKQGVDVKLFTFASLVFIGLGFPARSDEDLYISPVIQETSVWCWAAVTEMVFEHYGVENASPVGNFQCAIVGAAGMVSGATACFDDCRLCVVSAGTASNLVRVMEGYSDVASWYLGRSVKPVDVRHRDYPLSWEGLIDEIDSGNPVIAGISPGATISMTGVSQHVALIVGYEDDKEMLLVNDPYPFDLIGWGGGDPYENAGGEYVEMGQYLINYDSFIDNLNWGESFIVREN